MTYLFVVILLLVFSYKYDFNDNTNPQKKERAFWFVCAIFILVAGLRYNVGADTAEGYAPEYDSFATLGSSSWFSEMMVSRYQPGWFIFESFCRLLSPNFLLLQLLHAAFINIVYFYFIKKYSKLWFATVLIYAVSSFFLLDTEVLRESMAVAFSLLAFDSKYENNYVRMAIFAVLSFLFHLSGITVVVILLLSFLKDTKKTRIILLIILGVLTATFSSLNINDRYITMIFSEGQMDSYFSQSITKNLSTAGWILQFMQWLAFPLFMLFFIPVKDEKYNGTLMFIFFFLMNFARIYMYVFIRFANYFFPFYWIALSMSYFNIVQKKLYNSRLVILFLLAFIVYFIFYGSMDYADTLSDMFERGYERYFPYRSVLEPGNSYLRKF